MFQHAVAAHYSSPPASSRRSTSQSQNITRSAAAGSQQQGTLAAATNNNNNKHQPKTRQAELPPALKQLSTYLKSDDDLDKISALKEQLTKEKSTLEISLQNQSKLILDTTLNDLNKLQIASEDIKTLRESIQTINQVKEQSFGSIKRFELIDKITKIHEIFELSIDIHEKVSTFESDLKEVEALIDAIELDSIDEESDIPSLLTIHYKLNKLRDFQDQVLELAKFATDDCKFIIKRLFSKIFVVIGKFDKVLELIINLLVEICKAGTNNALIIKFAKIIEYEENQDLYIDLKKNVLTKKKGNSGSTTTYTYENDDVEKFVLFDQIVNGNIKGRLEARNYKAFFMSKLEETVKDMFEACWEMYEIKSQEEKEATMFDIISGLDWVYQDLKTVQSELIELTPANWNLFQLYYDLYFEQMQIIIKRLIDMEPETLIILEILDFDTTNQQIMKGEFQLPKQQIKSIFSDEEKEKLLNDYLQLLVMKMQEWILNLTSTEIDVFVKRLQAPSQDAEKLYLLEGNRIIFQMFTQQCDVAAGSGQGKILEGTIAEFSKHLLKRQQNWAGLIKSEVVKLLNSNHEDENKKKNKNKSGKPEEEGAGYEEEEVAPGLIEYLTALANDQMRGADYSEAISTKYSGMVSKKYSVGIIDNMESVIDGFANLAKQCCDAILVIIFDDLADTFNLVFHKKWINSTFIAQICETLNEYLADLQITLNSYLFEILMEDILEECIVRYLNALQGMTIGSKEMSKAMGQIKSDFEKFFKLFSGFKVDVEVIEHKFKVIETLFEIMEIPEYDESNNAQNFILRVEDIAQNLLDVYQDRAAGIALVKLGLVKFKKLKEKNLMSVPWRQLKCEEVQDNSFLSRLNLQL
ncbi:hypothetical protein WICPIJ_006365 [Wickerhamomyces pijperi]|uniref:Exocyst complex component Sec6 n=1 Tax=Wickerhamomyces pijperi TaxID=599730 RepID=A0A9P8TLG7_WICPI|nr:hypothetical protein WICPIJ_006365 [Wickerhamomyces pijperi]